MVPKLTHLRCSVRGHSKQQGPLQHQSIRNRSDHSHSRITSYLLAKPTQYITRTFSKRAEPDIFKNSPKTSPKLQYSKGRLFAHSSLRMATMPKFSSSRSIVASTQIKTRPVHKKTFSSGHQAWPLTCITSSQFFNFSQVKQSPSFRLDLTHPVLAVHRDLGYLQLRPYCYHNPVSLFEGEDYDNLPVVPKKYPMSAKLKQYGKTEWAHYLVHLANEKKLSQLNFQFALLKKYITPDLGHFHIVMNAQIPKNRIGTVLGLFYELQNTYYLQPTTQTFNILIHAFGSLGYVSEALLYYKQLLARKLQPNLATLSTILKIYQQHCLKNARNRETFFSALGLSSSSSEDELFETIRSWASQWNIEDLEDQLTCQMIGICCGTHQLQKAFALLTRLIEDHNGLSNSQALNVILHGLSKESSSLDDLIKIYHFFKKKIPDKIDKFTVGIVVNALAKSKVEENLSIAFNLVSEMQAMGLQPDAHIYAALMKGSLAHQPRTVENLFLEMKRHSIPYDVHNFNLLLLSMLMRHDFNTLMAYFRKEEQNTKPDFSTFSILIRACCANQRWVELEGFLTKIPLFMFKKKSSRSDQIRNEMASHILNAFFNVANSPDFRPHTLALALQRLTLFHKLSPEADALLINLMKKAGLETFTYGKTTIAANLHSQGHGAHTE